MALALALALAPAQFKGLQQCRSYAPTRDRNEGGGAPSSSIAISKPDSDPWVAKVLFGSLLTVLIVSEAVLFSGFATVSETWP